MKNFSTIVLVGLVSFTLGMLTDSKRMANDPEFHDYWMKRSKKPE